MPIDRHQDLIQVVCNPVLLTVLDVDQGSTQLGADMPACYEGEDRKGIDHYSNTIVFGFSIFSSLMDHWVFQILGLKVKCEQSQQDFCPHRSTHCLSFKNKIKNMIEIFRRPPLMGTSKGHFYNSLH